MIDSYFRSGYQRYFVDPLASKLANLNVAPNFVTILACFIGIGLLPAIASGNNSLALFLLLTSAYLDTLDGSLARKINRASQGGAMLDIVCDRMVEFCAVIGFYLYDPTPRGLSCLILLGSFYLCVTTFLVAGIFEKNHSHKGFHYSPGLIERTETIIFFGLAIIFENHFFILCMLFSSLVFFTALVRLFQGIKQFEKST